MKTLPVICLSFLLAAGLQAQSRFSATTGDVVLSGSGTKFTIQQPAVNAKQVSLEAAVAFCSVACDVTISQNGAAATATAGTARSLLPFGMPASATIWTASDVGAGTAAGGILHLAAGERVTLDLSLLSMGNTGNRTNFTVVVASITGTANISLFWREQ